MKKIKFGNEEYYQIYSQKFCGGCQADCDFCGNFWHKLVFFVPKEKKNKKKKIKKNYFPSSFF